MERFFIARQTLHPTDFDNIQTIEMRFLRLEANGNFLWCLEKEIATQFEHERGECMLRELEMRKDFLDKNHWHMELVSVSKEMAAENE